jgi:hypothetical protein
MYVQIGCPRSAGACPGPAWPLAGSQQVLTMQGEAKDDDGHVPIVLGSLPQLPVCHQVPVLETELGWRLYL